MLVTALVAGCASERSKPLPDIRAIEGGWRGAMDFGGWSVCGTLPELRGRVIR